MTVLKNFSIQGAAAVTVGMTDKMLGEAQF